MEKRQPSINLSDVTSRFSSRPLFDDALSKELERYEKRTLAGSRQAEVPHHVSLASADSDPLLGYRKRAVVGAPPQEDGSSLPPSIPRPWSVDHLIMRSRWVGAGVAGHTKVDDSDVPDDERRGHLDGVKENPREKRRKQASRQNVGLHHYSEDSDSSGDNAPTQIRRGAGGHRNRQPQLALSDDEHDYRYNSDFYASKGRLKGGQRMDGPSSDEAANSPSYRRSAAPLVQGEPHTLEPISEELMGTHIERAQARKLMQETRLGSLGIRAPGTKVEFSTQTDAPNEDDVLLGNADIDRTIAKRESEQRGGGGGGRRDAPSQGRDEGLVLLPQVPYREAAPSENHTSSGTDTVWHKMLAETKRRDHFPGAYEMPEVSNPWLTILDSNANAPSAKAAHGKHQASPQSRNPNQPTQGGNRPRAMFDQLDRMQLDHEELLLRNNIIKDPLPSSFGGVFGAPADEEQMVRDAVAHVAAAHRDPNVHNEVMERFRPTGGYGSVTDSGFRTQPQVHHDSQADRWNSAKRNLERERDTSANASVPLRKWASELPTKYVGTVGNEETIPMRSGATQHGVGWDNPAKRKWGNISFTAPDQSLPGGTLEDISQRAKGRMAPDFS